jgi:uncharacterized protein (TIGR00369 family)
MVRMPRLEGVLRNKGAQARVPVPLKGKIQKSRQDAGATREKAHDEDGIVVQQHGNFHAGVAAAIADGACGYAAHGLMPVTSSVLTVEYKINLVAPAAGESLIARARVLRSGKTLKICAADVVAVKDGKETLCATTLSTIMAMQDRSDMAAKS